MTKPTSPALGELPTLEHLVKGSLPPLDRELRRKSDYYYKDRVPEENVTVSLPSVAIPPREDFLTRFKRGAKPLRPDYYKKTPKYYSEERFDKFLQRAQPQWRERYNVSREEARRRAEQERRRAAERRDGPELPAKIVATPRRPIAPTQKEPVQVEPRAYRTAGQKFVEKDGEGSSDDE